MILACALRSVTTVEPSDSIGDASANRSSRVDEAVCGLLPGELDFISGHRLSRNGSPPAQRVQAGRLRGTLDPSQPGTASGRRSLTFAQPGDITCINLCGQIDTARKRGADMRIYRPATIFAPAFLIFSSLISGQVSTATFYGIVNDPTGAVVPGAAVTVTNVETALAYHKTSDSSGEFGFDFLPTGTYTLRIEAQ